MLAVQLILAVLMDLDWLEVELQINEEVELEADREVELQIHGEAGLQIDEEVKVVALHPTREQVGSRGGRKYVVVEVLFKR